MFVLLPFIIWMFDTSVSSELSFARFSAAFNSGLGFVPGWFVKLVALGLIWAYLHHFIAGLRHVWMDISHEAVTQAVRRPVGQGHAGAEHRADGRAGRRSCSASTDFAERNTMAVNYGTRRTVVGAHYGLRDWLSQRVTAVLMALFTLIVLAQVLFSRGPIGYDSWAGIFASQWMKVLTFAVIVGLVWHVWVGMRDVLMDYIKPLWLRLALQVFVIVWLIGCAGWAIQVLWRV